MNDNYITRLKCSPPLFEALYVTRKDTQGASTFENKIIENYFQVFFNK